MPEMRHPPATAPQLPAGVSFPADNNESAMSDSSGQNSVPETGVNSASEAGAVSLDPSVTYKDEEETIVDTDQIRVVVQGYEPNGQSEDGKRVFKSRLSVENKTQNEVELYFESCAVNRFSTDMDKDIVIAAKGTEEVTLEFDIGVLSAAGIVSVDEIDGLIDEWYEEDVGYNHISNTFRFYPTGKKAEDVIAADPVTEDDLTVLADNEHLLFGILKHNAKTDFLLSDSKNKEREVYFYAVNRDEETMSLTLGKLSVNGNDYYVYVEDDDSSEQGKKTFMDHYRIGIMSCCPGCTTVSGIPLDDRFMDENQIGSIEDITDMTLGLSVSHEGEYPPIYADLLVYNAEGNGGESALKPAYADVDYVQEEQLIVDRDEYKLSVTGYDPESVVMNQWDCTFEKAFLIHLKIQNKTDEEWTYIVGKNVSVNYLPDFGISKEDEIQVRVPAGETGEFVCYIPSDRFEKSGIDSVDEVTFSLSGGPKVITSYHYAEYEVFPTGMNHISFDIEDFDGKAVNSKDIFAGSKITMINLWTTWSGSFVKKLPELESLSSEFEKKGCRIVGICLNADEEKEEALSILQDAGVTFLNLAATDDLKDVFRFKSIPTTYFVDSEGNLLSDPVEGTDINLFQETLDSLLEDLD